MEYADVDTYAKILWNYHHLSQPIQPADILFVLGSHDLRVPSYAASLFHRGLAALVLISGGIAHTDDLLRTGWDISEAEKFAQVLTKAGVPHEKLLLETQAHHTGENFRFGREVLETTGISYNSVLVVTNPMVERRVFALGTKLWPDKQLIITSPPLSFEEYVNGPIPKEDIIHLLVGNLQRLRIYGEKGIQVPQLIPSEVWGAYEALRQMGYNKHLLTEAQIATIQ